MKDILLILFFISIMNINAVDPSKVLIIYFTRTGNTELFANYIKELSSISSYKIEPVTPYPDDYNTMLNLARQERSNNVKPEIKDPLKDISQYDTILLGYPIWHSYVPNIVLNQLEQLDFTGKTIYPFNTHGGSGVGNSISDIKNYATNAGVKDGFAISQSNIKNEENSKNLINDWLNNRVNLDNESTSSASTVQNTDKTTTTTTETSSKEEDSSDSIEIIGNNSSLLCLSYIINFILLLICLR